MNNHNLIEFQKKFKLLSEYNTSLTFSENKKLITEQATVIDDLLKVAKNIDKLKSFFKYTDEFINQVKTGVKAAKSKFLDDILKTKGAKAQFPEIHRAVVNKTVDDILESLKSGSPERMKNARKFAASDDVAKKNFLTKNGQLSEESADDIIKEFNARQKGTKGLPSPSKEVTPSPGKTTPPAKRKPIRNTRRKLPTNRAIVKTDLPGTEKVISQNNLTNYMDDVVELVNSTQNQPKTISWWRKNLKNILGVAAVAATIYSVISALNTDGVPITTDSGAPLEPISDVDGVTPDTGGGTDTGQYDLPGVNYEPDRRRFDEPTKEGVYIYVPSYGTDPWDYRYNTETKRWETKKYPKTKWIDVDVEAKPTQRMIGANDSIRKMYDSLIQPLL